MCFFLITAIYALDQVSKVFIAGFLSQGESVPLLKDFFHITLVHNTGAAFGILKGRPDIFIVIAAVSSILIAGFLFFRRNFLTRPERFALCSIFAGTLGNLTDRLRFGYVVDFLDFRIWPVFNVADTFISIGAGLLIIHLFLAAHSGKKTDSSGGAHA